MQTQADLVARSADLVTLQLLTAIARTGSITAAGAQLGMTQQGASARVRMLEEALELPLLARGRRGSSLTTEGSTVAMWAAQVTEAADRFVVAAEAIRGGAEPFTIASSMTISEFFLPRWLLSLRERADIIGQLSVTSVNSDRVVELVRAGEARIGFIESPAPPSGLTALTVARDELVVVVAPRHRWARLREIGPTEFARTPSLVRERGSGARLAVEEVLSRAGLTAAEPLVELPTNSAVRSAVADGVGAAVLSVINVRDDVAAGRLVRVRVRGLRFPRELRAVYRPGAERDGVVSAILSAAARHPEV
ncbi:LysR family transcriptional regulator [Gryllotalpicola reticulitermitis]|uniref:LysR family transcriptional regulator n=1 Tax=Gryllotalpicola reticulitermitis TaxID=1184153 RepID=A0ABV8Q4C1_9MICO